MKLSTNEDSKLVDAVFYRQLVGSLIYLNTTKPDLINIVQILSWSIVSPVIHQSCTRMDFQRAAKV
jgi:hypothetical protein